MAHTSLVTGVGLVASGASGFLGYRFAESWLQAVAASVAGAGISILALEAAAREQSRIRQAVGMPTGDPATAEQLQAQRQEFEAARQADRQEFEAARQADRQEFEEREERLRADLMAILGANRALPDQRDGDRDASIAPAPAPAPALAPAPAPALAGGVAAGNGSAAAGGGGDTCVGRIKARLNEAIADGEAGLADIAAADQQLAEAYAQLSASFEQGSGPAAAEALAQLARARRELASAAQEIGAALEQIKGYRDYV